MKWEEIAKELGVSRNTAKNIYDTAMRKLSSPQVGRKLKDYT